MTKNITIIKASGEREIFDENKLRQSLLRCNAKSEDVEKVISHINNELEDGMTTDHIYRHAFFVLRKIGNPEAVRKYSLRRALIELGPTGFPFEKFLGELFKEKGYEVRLNQIVLGTCVSHEMDVVAFNEAKLIMIESKFHNQLGEKSDLKVSLYIKARFDDLLDQTFDYGKPRFLDEGYLITNTKFTEQAIKYGECAKVRMIGWNYPKIGNLEQMIEDSGLHPITCMSSLSQQEKQLLLNNGVILCKQIIEKESVLLSLGVNKNSLGEVVEEARLVSRR